VNHVLLLSDTLEKLIVQGKREKETERPKEKQTISCTLSFLDRYCSFFSVYLSWLERLIYAHTHTHSRVRFFLLFTSSKFIRDESIDDVRLNPMGNQHIKDSSTRASPNLKSRRSISKPFLNLTGSHTDSPVISSSTHTNVDEISIHSQGMFSYFIFIRLTFLHI